ncbi:nucleotide-binding alpha-beta plait domain-containing protein [Tanacetum coccineum]
MSYQRTKEDDVAKISTSIFVMNFPDICSAKDLFNSCKQYGNVVDAFIPLKRFKAGKRFQRSPANVDKNAQMNGGVKEFASLANLKVMFNNEGFTNMKIYYMGELWVMMEFGTDKSMSLFRENVSVGSWFSQINKASMDFVTEGRIAWVELEGIPLKLWSGNTFKRIAAKWGVLLDIDDQEESCFHSNRICVHTKSNRIISDELKIIFRGKVFWIRAKETTRWVPDFPEEVDEDDQSDVNSKDGMKNVKETGFGDDSDIEGESESSLKHPPGFTPKEGRDGLQVNEEEVRGSNRENGDEACTGVDNNVFGD